MKCAVLAVLLLWSAGATVREAPRHQEVRQVMGTLATVQVWAADEGVAQAAADSAFVVFSAVDSLMSTWNGNSALSRLNAAPVGTWVAVGPELSSVIQAALIVAGRTEGAFDPTVLPLVKLWGFRGGRPTVPDESRMHDVLNSIGYEAVELEGDRARLGKTGCELDLGGIAKGHALDRAAAAMARAGATGGVLDLGGNLLVFGHGPEPEVGVVDPDDPGAMLLTLPLSEGSVATSGQYERFVSVEGRSLGHIIDPRTGWPVPAGISATVLAPRALRADALATAVVVLGRERGLALLENTPNVEGVIIGADGAVWATRGLQKALAARLDEP